MFRKKSRLDDIERITTLLEKYYDMRQKALQLSESAEINKYNRLIAIGQDSLISLVERGNKE